MPNTIDERVVEMKFNNAQFEQNVSKSMSTIEKLEKSLQFKGVEKGFENINTAAKKTNLSPISEAVESVKLKFSALEIVGITTLTNLTNSAVNMAKKMASALTIEPIKTGFQEYETQLNSTQTILANTQKEGTKIEDVNAALDELNHYADLTIYNFTEMTRNIGTFTAAGVKLKTSVESIKGIANLAAVSGSTSQQASVAMYQLSQALASGTVKLMDWNSVVNAGMGGQVFQDALKETARLHGVAIDQMIADEGSFRESLKNGWLSADILTETLKKFTTSGVNEYLAEYTGKTVDSIAAMRQQAVATGDQETAFRKMAETLAENSTLGADQIYNLLKMSQTAEEAATKVKTLTQLWDVLKEAAQSGWSASWRIIMGDYEEAKETLTKVSDTLSNMISASADARIKMLTDWKALGGRTDLIDSIGNAFKALMAIIKPVKDAFRDVFPATTGTRLAILTEDLKSFTKTLIITEERGEFIKKTFTAVFKVFKVGVTIIKNVAKIFSKIASVVTTLAGKLFDLADSVTESTGIFDKFSNAIDGLIYIIDSIGDAISNAIEFIGNLANELEIAQAQAFIFEKVSPVIKKVGDTLATVAKIAGTVALAFGVIAGSAIVTAISFIYTKFIQIVEAIKNVNISVEGLKEKFGVFGGSVIAVILKVFSKIKDLKDAVIEFVKGDSVQNSLTNFADILVEFKDKFVSFVDVVLAKIKEFGLGRALIVAYVGAMMYTLVSLSKSIRIVSNGLKTALGGAGSMFDSLTSAIKSIATINNTTPMVLKVALAIAILAGSLALLTSLPQKELQSASKTLLIVMGALAAVSTVLSIIPTILSKVIKGFEPAKMTALGTSMLSMAGSIAILIIALKSLETLEVKDIWTRVGVLGAVLGGLSAFATILSKFAPKFSMTSLTLIAFAYGIKKFIEVIAGLSDDQYGAIKRNIVALGEVFGLLSLMMIGVSNIRIRSAIGILATVAAVKVLCASVKELKISFDGLDTTALNQIMMKAIAILSLVTGLSLILGEVVLKNDRLGLNKTILSIGTSLLMAAAGMYIVAKAIAIFKDHLSTIQNSNVDQMLWTLTALFTIVTLVSVKAANASREAGMAFAAFGVGILAIAKGLTFLKDLLNALTLGEIAGVIGIMAGLTAVFAYVAEASKNSGKAYKSILAMAATLWAVVGLATVVSILTPSQLAKVGAVAVGISGVMYALGVALSKMQKLESKAPAMTILSISAALLSLTASIGILSQIKDADAMTRAVISLGGMVAILGVFLYSLSNQYDSAQSAMNTLKVLTGMSGLMLAVSASIAIMANSFMTLNSIDWEKAGNSIITIGTILGGLVAALLVIGELNQNGKITGAMVTLSVSLLALSASITIMSDAFAKLIGIDWTVIASAAGAIVGMTAALGILGTIVGNAGPLGLIGVPVLAASLILLAYACRILAPAMVIMAQAFTIGLEAIGAFVDQLTAAFDNFTISLGNLITAISVAGLNFSQSAINIATAINMIVDALFRLAGMSTAQAGQIAANFMIISAGLTAAFGIGMAGVILAGITAIIAAIDVLIFSVISKFSTAQSQFNNLGTTIIDSFAKGITSNKKGVQSAGESLMTTFIASLKSRGQSVYSVGRWVGISFVQGINDQCRNAAAVGATLGKFSEEGLRNAIQVHSMSPLLYGVGEWFGISYNRGSESQADNSYIAGQTLGQSSYNGVNSFTEMISSLGTTQGNGYASNFMNVVQSAWGWAKNKLRDISGKTKLASGAKNDVAGNREMSKIWNSYSREEKEYYGSFDNFVKQYKSGGEVITHTNKTVAKSNDDVADSYDDVIAAADKAKKSGGGASKNTAKEAKEVKTVAKEAAEAIIDYSDYFNVFSYAGEQVEKFHKQYASTLDTISDVDPVQASKNAIELFALKLYANTDKMKTANKEYQESVNKVLETEMTVTERSKKLADLKAEHIKKRTQEIQETYEAYVKSVKDGIQNDIDMLSEFKSSDETTMDTYLDNMQSQIDALNTWEYKMRELAKRDDMTPEMFQYLIDKGFNGGYNLVNELFESTDDQFEEFKDKFTRLANDGSLTNLVADSIVNSMAGLHSKISQAGTDEIQQAVYDMDKNLGDMLNKVNPDETLGSKLKDSMKSSFNTAIEEITDNTEGYKEPIKTAFTSIGDAAAMGMYVGIKNGIQYLFDPAKEMGEAVKEATKDSIDAHSPSRDFMTIGGYIIDGLVIGIKEGVPSVENAMTEVGMKAKEAFSNILGSGNFLPSGKEIVTYIADGVTEDFSNIKKAITDAIDKARLELSSLAHDRFHTIGEQMVQGMIDGIMSKIEDLREAARELAEAAESEAEDELDINSPSKKFFRIGSFTGEGFVNGLKSYVSTASRVAGRMADDTISVFTDSVRALANVMVEEYDEPTITPVLDLSEIQNGSKAIGSLLDKNSGFNLSATSNSARMAARDFNSSNSNPAASSNGAQAPTYSFTQNNYSPKALSRIDIYRQTKNQFSALKGTT